MPPGRGMAGAQPPAHRFALDAERPGNRPGGQALVAQANRFGIAGVAALLSRLRPPFCAAQPPLRFGGDRPGSFAHLPRRLRWRAHHPSGGAEVTMMVFQNRAKGIAGVAQQMPPVRDLEGVRRPTRRPLGIGAGAVAHDDGDAGVGCQPRRQCVGAAVGEQVDDAPALEVAQDRSVAVALAPGPVVHAQNRHWGGRHVGADAHPVHQRCPADRHAHGPGMRGPWVATERQTNGPVHGPQPVGLACPRAGDAGQGFGKGAARTGGIGAAEAPDADQQHGGASEARHITKAAPVGAVNAA